METNLLDAVSGNYGMGEFRAGAAEIPLAFVIAILSGFCPDDLCLWHFGTIFGFFLSDLLPPDILRVVIFITPIYILLLIINARQKANRLAVFIGGVLSPVFFPFAGEWAILIAGILGGSLASLYGRFIAKWHLEPVQ